MIVLIFCSEEKLIKLRIHYGGTMKKVEDDYNYLQELGSSSVSWKLTEIVWNQFDDFIRPVCVTAPISLIWFKEAREEMKMVKYVFDTTDYDMGLLRSSANSAGEIDVFLEHECSEHVVGDVVVSSISVYDGEDDGGYAADEDERMGEERYEPDEDERMREDIYEGDEDYDDEIRPPKEDDDPEDSEDELATESK